MRKVLLRTAYKFDKSHYQKKSILDGKQRNEVAVHACRLDHECVWTVKNAVKRFLDWIPQFIAKDSTLKQNTRTIVLRMKLFCWNGTLILATNFQTIYKVKIKLWGDQNKRKFGHTACKEWIWLSWKTLSLFIKYVRERSWEQWHFSGTKNWSKYDKYSGDSK